MIYLIGPDKQGPLKIGKANDPDKRCRAIQHYSPWRLQIFASGSLPLDRVHFDMPFLKGDKDQLYRYVERIFHGIFHEYRSHGEWFDISVDRFIDGVLSSKDKCRVWGHYIPPEYKKGRPRRDENGARVDKPLYPPHWYFSEHNFNYKYPYIGLKPDSPAHLFNRYNMCTFHATDVDWDFKTVEPIANEVAHD